MFNKILASIVIVLVIIGIGMLLAIPTWLLWNWLMPTIFGLRKITLVEAFGLTLLSNILFGSKRLN